MQAMVLPRGVTFALERLQNAGATAYLVGGCVRDHLRGVLPHDYDIATDFLPEEVLRIFSDCRTVPTGLQHGTVTVLVDDTPLEITTFRVDGDYLDANKQPIPEFFELVTYYEKKLEYAKQNTSLPEKPDYNRIRDFVMGVNERVVKGEV